MLRRPPGSTRTHTLCPYTTRFRAAGVAEILGGDLTGKRLSEGCPAAAQDGVLAHISAVRDERLIGLLTSNVAKPGHEHRCITVVELPLQNVSGAGCQILHVCFSAPAGDGRAADDRFSRQQGQRPSTPHRPAIEAGGGSTPVAVGGRLPRLLTPNWPPGRRLSLPP